MYVEADAVAEAMAEIRPVARVGDDLRRRAVYLRARDAGARRGYARLLRGQDRGVDVFHLIRGASDGDGAGHVGAVAVLHAAEVHGDEVARRDALVPRDAVGHAALRAGDDDGVEGVALRAVQAHPVGYLGGDLPLHRAGLQERQDLLQGLFRYPLRGDEAPELLLGLAGAQGDQQLLSGQQLAAQGALHAQVERVAELLLLGAELLYAQAVGQLAQDGAERALPRRQQDLHARGRLLLRGLYIARVRDEPGPLRADQRRAVRGQKARGVVDVPVVHEQDGVQARAGHGFFDSFGVCHFQSASNVLFHSPRNMPLSSSGPASLWPRE